MSANPFLISTHDLGRSPGSHRDYSLTVPAPADLGTDVIGVPEGAELELQLGLTAVSDGVLATLAGTVPLAGECVRCLAPLQRQQAVQATEMFFYPSARLAAAHGEDDDELAELSGEGIDFEPLLRDAVVLDLPFDPLCRPDCRGLCPDCGLPWAELPADHGHEVIDPRWAALAALQTPQEDK